MPGDIERATFRPELMFASVEYQQGRLLLTADLNEQSAIHNHFLRTFIADLKGSAWRVGTGFEIDASGADLKPVIKEGHFYVDGILCNNVRECPYDAQPFSPVPAEPGLEDAQDAGASFYLDSWERSVSYLNYPLLRDAALGPADSAGRFQIAWQVRLLTLEAAKVLGKEVVDALNARMPTIDPVKKAELTARVTRAQAALAGFAAPLDAPKTTEFLDCLDLARPQMAARARNDVKDTDPCAIPADSEYRGRENQLYRIEIHRPGTIGGAVKPTFKWSRENASVGFKVIEAISDSTNTKVTLESLGHDRRTGLCVDQWVELFDETNEFEWSSGPLLRVKSIDISRRIATLEGTVTVDHNRKPILRRWDHTGTAKAEGAVPVAESSDDSGWIELERGISIQFAPGGVYRKGDFWLIAARVPTGDVDWPTLKGKPLAIEPHGIKHHRAALATVVKAAGAWSATQS